MDGLDGTIQRLADFPDVGALDIKGDWQRVDDSVLIRSVAWP